VVHEAVAHAGGGTPRHLGQRCAAFGRDALGGFADDLDELGQREPEQLVVVEVAALLVRAVVDGLGGSLAQVADPGPAVRPHTAGGRST
jgi:hypothetical protein